MKNQQVKANLERLFNANLVVIKNISVESFLDELIADPVTMYNPETGEISGSFYEEEIDALKEAREDSEILDAFRKVQELDFDDSQIIESFKKDIIAALAQIKSKIDAEKCSFSNQIIFLENDFEAYAYFCGFGKGNYPILSKPELFNYNFHEELYNGVGKIDYSIIWKDLFYLNDLVQDVEIFDQIVETDYFENLQNAVKFKTYLLLHEAFEQLGIEAFDGIKIEKPLFIYANEHDCPAMNIAVFE